MSDMIIKSFDIPQFNTFMRQILSLLIYHMGLARVQLVAHLVSTRPGWYIYLTLGTPFMYIVIETFEW